MPQIQGVGGEAAVSYCEPSTTPKMGYHRLSRRVNKIEIKYKHPYFADARGFKIELNEKNN